MNALDRIKQYIKYKGLSVRQFEDSTGFSNGGFGSQQKKGKTIGVDKLENILHVYTDLNAEWILTGEGSMLKPDDKQSTNNDKPLINYAKRGNPYFNVDFAAGFSLFVNDQTVNPDYYIDFFPFNEPGAIWCNATGDSMIPDILSGDKIVLKRINDPSVMPLGEIYGIVTDEFRTIKRIRKASDENHWLLVPSNPNFDSQEVAKDKVRAIFKLLGTVRTF